MARSGIELGTGGDADSLREPAVDGLFAVLVNYRRWLDAWRTVRYLALAGLPPERVVVVDSASGDGSAERLAERLPAGTLLPLARNLGFAGGADAGAALALARGAEALLFLNTDTAFAPDFLARLTAGPGPLATTCASPEIFWAGEPERPWFAGAWRGRLPGTFRARRPGDPRTEVDYIWACCLLVGREAWRRAGPLDPGYFLYYEDMAWSDRARAAGLTLSMRPAARLWHAVGAASGGPASALGRYHRTRSSLRYFRRQGAAALAVRALADGRTAMDLALRGQSAALAAHLAGWRDGWREP